MIRDLIGWLFFTLYDGVRDIFTWIYTPIGMLTILFLWESWIVWGMFYERDKKIEDLENEIERIKRCGS